MAPGAEAYPIFAQQNFADPVDPTGKLVCANCHLQTREINLRMPHEVLPDTIFKIKVDLPLKYDIRRQLNADGEKVELNAGAVVVLPEGWKLAPRDRLPKEIKKEMKGLAWSAYSKEKTNIIVAGPVPGKMYSQMILPVLAPVPDGADGEVHFGKFDVSAGGNRGRGQVYPDGNVSNNNVFLAPEPGTVKSIEGDIKKTVITIEKKDGSTYAKEVLAGADVVVEVGDKITKDMQLTTNPNVGGFGQDERDIILQDMDRVNNVMALMVSIFIAQLGFVLKKKQFEKVQLAEGF
jgi:apocytochrome f